MRAAVPPASGTGESTGAVIIQTTGLADGDDPSSGALPTVSQVPAGVDLRKRAPHQPPVPAPVVAARWGADVVNDVPLGAGWRWWVRQLAAQAFDDVTACAGSSSTAAAAGCTRAGADEDAASG